jgi:hypothetical protein
MDQVVTDDLEQERALGCRPGRTLTSFLGATDMASRIIFELDDAGAIVNVIHEPVSPPPNAPLPTGDEASLARRLLRACGVVDIESTLASYPCPRIISVACYGLWKLQRKQIRTQNPSGLVLTVLRRGSEVPDVVDQILKAIRKPDRSEEALNQASYEAGRKLLEEYLAKRSA